MGKEENPVNPLFSSDGNDHVLNRLTNWNCLKRLGYKFSKTENKMLSSGNMVRTFIFANQRDHRKIEICDYHSLGMGPVFVRNTKNDEEITFAVFVVEDWLDYHATDLTDDFSRGKYIQIEFATKETGAEPFLEFLERLFMGPLKPILIGETWENVPWDDTYK
jgi:hypothetical protein